MLCTDKKVSSLGCVAFAPRFSTLSTELRCLLSFPLVPLPLYLSLRAALLLSAPWNVQSELGRLLPGGERVMVLLSGGSEMDSSGKARECEQNV